MKTGRQMSSSQLCVHKHVFIAADAPAAATSLADTGREHNHDRVAIAAICASSFVELTHATRGLTPPATSITLV